jgi:RHS repeat-associated protein
MSTTLEQIQYGFDRDSRRTWQRRSLTDTQDKHYSYDALGQVGVAARGSLNLNMTAISGIPASAQSWDYDPTGNWRGYHTAVNGSSTQDQHRVHDRGNRLTQIEDNPLNMILDRVGRMRQMAPDAEGDWDGKLEITWDAWSRITNVKNNGTVVGEYSYDGRHRRITRDVDGETLHSYYNNQWRPVEERKDAETTANMSYLWGARHRDDLVRRDRAVSGTTFNETRYVLMDYFNPAAITDAGGVVKERYAFSAFGVRTILNPDFTVRSSSECGMEFGFQGQFLDLESGLMNYGYRYYSPQIGRWTCKDPIGEKGGVNLYVISVNSTTNLVDRLGLFGAGYEMQLLADGPAPDGMDNAFWPVGGGDYLGEEKYWEQRIPNLLEQARSQFTAQVNSWVVMNCGKSPFGGASKRIAVVPGPQTDPSVPNQLAITKFGDREETHVEETEEFGSFALDITTPIIIAYKRSSDSALIFSWKTTLYLEDRLGYNADQSNAVGRLLAPNRMTKRAIWNLEGIGCCIK